MPDPRPARSEIAESPLRKKWGRGFRADALLLLAAVLALCVLLPVYHAGGTPSEFGFLKPSVFLRAAAWQGLAVFIPLLLVCLLLRGGGWSGASRGWAVFVLAWVALAGFALPLVHATGMVEAVDARTHGVHLFGVVVLAAGFAGLSRTRLAPAPVVFCLVLMVSAAVPKLPEFLGALKRTERTSGVAEVSPERNIFVISFDGVPGVVVRRVLADHPDLAEAFRDFVFFTNAVSQAPATHASARAELFGNRNYHALGATDEEVDASLALDSLLMNNVENLFTYGSYNDFNLDESRWVRSLGSEQAGGREAVTLHIYWLEMLWARIGTPWLPAALHQAGLSAFLERRVAGPASAENEMSRRLQQYAGPAWKTGYIRQLSDYRWFVKNLKAVRPGLCVRYLHFIHTHFPVDFDEHGNFRGDDPAWFKANQNFNGLYNQCRGTLEEFAALLEQLRELGIYDQSLVVFKSDHGKPVAYYDFFPHDVRINGHELWGVDRYLPLLMIKDFARRGKKLETCPDLVSLADLARTLCRAAGVAGTDDHEFPGRDLLSSGPASESPSFYAEIVTGPDSTFHFDTHRTVELERSRGSVYDALAASGQVELSSPAQDAEP